MKKIRLNSRGDTIIEVLLSIAALSFVLSISYGLANTSAKTNIAARERSEAQKLSERQLELLRGYVDPEQGQEWEDTDRCFKELDGTVTKVAAECEFGPQARYIMEIDVSGNATEGYVYTVFTNWDNVKGGTDQLKLSYKLPATGDIASSLPPPSLPQCIDTIDNDGDGTIDFTGYNGFPPDDGCSGPLDDLEESFPSPPLISPNSYSYTAWHMYNNGNTAPYNVKKSQLFTVTNPSNSPASLNITGASITGSNASSFQIISNSCTSGTVLTRGQSCTVRVQFFPPSGPSNNRLSNAGEKKAELRVSSSNASSVEANLTGWAVTDRIAPSGNPFPNAENLVAASSNAINYKRALRGYNNSCYNDAFNCPTALVVNRNNDLALYRSGIGNNPSQTIASCNGSAGGAFLVMASDGNLTFNYQTTCWASLQNLGIGNIPGRWLYLRNGGELWFMRAAFTGGNPSGKYEIKLYDL
ncbi:hypothetical protein KY385_03360 [Candidatus Parcubacteria bacterium]|nr:hypothetical protein [Candidatus Parcubacteria bacterium]